MSNFLPPPSNNHNDQHPLVPYSGQPPAAHMAPADAEADDALDEIDLKEVLGVLRRHVKLIAAVTILAGAAAGYIAHRSRPDFQAGAVIRLVDQKQALTSGLDDQNALSAMTGMGSFVDPVLSQLQVLKSRDVASQVVDRHPIGLRFVPRDFPASILRDAHVPAQAPGDTLQLEFGDSAVTVTGRGGERHAAYGAPIDIDDVHFAVAHAPPKGNDGTLVIVPRHKAIDQLQLDLGASARKNTDVIDVSYTAHDPLVAQQVVNTTVDVFQGVSASTSQQQSKRRREFVQAQLEQTDSILTAAQRTLSDFQTNKKVFGTPDMVAAEQTALLQLDMQREQMNADRQMYESLLKGITHDGGVVSTEKLQALVSSGDIAQNPVITQLYTQLVKYEGIRDSIATGTWGSAKTNPDVERINMLIDSAQASLVSAAQSHIDALSARIAALDELKQRNVDQIAQMPATAAAEARLAQRVEATRKVADQLREEYQKARIAEAVDAGQVEIIDLAVVPDLPIGHGPIFKIALGLMVGLMLGAGGAFLKEHLNSAIRRRDEIEKVLQIPGLAIIPQIAGSANANRLRLAGVNMPRLRAKTNGNGNSRNGYTLVTVTDDRSSSAEAFRTLRTNLIFSQAVQTLHTIVVTSPQPGDGKTTTSSNLSVTFAQQGMRVILVDCDLRRARLHNVFHVTREPGLSQYLLGQCSLEDAVRPTVVDGLTFMPAGALPPNPAELLGGPQMRSALDVLRQSYDVVILDSAPVHVGADTLVLGTMADGVILVLRAGQTDLGAAQDALQRLKMVKARVVGAVLNDPDQKVPQYGGVYYYDYYGDETKKK
ncbi:MAG TPA: polysaccharide biosynthesis tyrosine autokinase [Gemmatimonadaceae bacterium]